MRSHFWPHPLNPRALPFIMFRWRCGLYKKLAPELKKLGTSLKKVKSVSMGKTLPNKQFPHGLRVLLVGSDQATLRIIEKMSSRCNYHVTKCSEAAVALNLLRERKGCFDIVLSDDYMEDMDSDKFIQHVQLEINLPLVIISSDERTSSVMKGLRNGACDYLIKPVREEVWRNIWQHVWRRQLKVKKEYENSGCFEDNHDRNIQRNYDDDAEATTSLLDATRKEGIVNAPTKRSIKEEDDGELVNNDDPPLKKRRVVWSAELHEQFVSAVNQLGLDKAVPKAILELMNVHGLTRENVASHLQKYRLFLKRLSGEGHHHQHINGMPINTISGSAESKLGRSDIEALARLTPQAVAVFHPDLLVYHHPNHNPLLEHSKNSPHHSILTLEDVTSLGWSHNSNTNIPSSVGPNGGMGGLVHDKNVLLNILHQHRLHQQKQQGNFSYGTIPPSSTSISSCTASASIIHQQQQNPALGLPYGTKCGDDALNLAAEPVRNHGFVIPTRYSPLEMESSVNDLKEGNIAVVDSDHNTVNEPNMDLIDNLGVGLSPVLQRFPSFDYTFME